MQRMLQYSMLGASRLAILGALAMGGAERAAGAPALVPDDAFPCLHPVLAGSRRQGLEGREAAPFT